MTASGLTALSGRYRVDRELGAGGMATVYLARDHTRRRSNIRRTRGMKRVLSMILPLALVRTVGTAQGLPAIDPGTAGFSAAGLRALDSVMKRYTASDRFPAAMVMIARHGRVAYWKAYGVRDIEKKIPLERNDVFRAYSLTKPIVVAALLQLMEQGKLALDDPAERYVPALARLRVQDGSGGTREPKRKLTIRHLLTWTSGLTYGLWGNGSAADSAALAADVFGRATSLDDVMNRIADVPLVDDPGASVSYGWQADVIGKIVETVSRQPLDRYLARHIFAPLRMTETGFFAPTASMARMPLLYVVADGKAPEVAAPAAWTGAYGSPPKVFWGGHGLVTTPSDYMRFAQMIANKGELDGVRLLRTATVQQMTSAQIGAELPAVTTMFGPGQSIGFGCVVATNIAQAGGGGHDGLYFFSGAANLFTWTDRTSGIVAHVWAQANPFMVYPLFADVRRAVAEAAR
jgi:CubicO group peptidase (beta-lactamase class C family)